MLNVYGRTLLNGNKIRVLTHLSHLLSLGKAVNTENERKGKIRE